MPTTRGWTALGAGLGSVALWVGFGETELLAAGALLIIAVVVGLVFVRRSAPDLEIGRRMNPPLAHESGQVVVELDLNGRRRIRNLTVEDTVHGIGSARFAAARLDADHPVVGRYEVLCRRRGVYPVGPATVSVTDPFGLAELHRPVGAVDRLTVYPRIEELSGFPPVRGRDPSVQSTRPTYSPVGGEDFFTLREYQLGDDLRKVHWPSSAKRDDLMIRQLEVPWQSRAMVLLDQRASAYSDEDAFEHAVRGAASVVDHLHRGGYSPELWSAESLPATRSGNPYLQAMDQLATVQLSTELDLRRAIARLRRRGLGGGALVIVTGRSDDAVLAAYRALARDFTRTVVMSVDPDPGEAMTFYQRAGAVTVAVDPESDWAPAWRGGMEVAWATA